MPELSRSDLAALSGCSEAMLATMAELGLLDGDGERFESADATRARLALALHEAGLPLSTLAEAVRTRSLSLDFAGQLMFEPVSLTRRRSDEVLAELDLPAELVRRLRGAMGLSELGSEQTLREDDLELIEIIALARQAGLADDSLARVLRVFGHSVRRTVEAMRDLFRSQVEEPALAAGISHGDMLAGTAETRLKLQRLGFRTLYLLQRRLLEDAVFDNVVTRIQALLPESGAEPSPAREAPTVVFADLAGFTRLTQEIGDAGAAEQASAFEALAYETAVLAGGQFIKSLGDGVMLLFRAPQTAVETSFKLQRQARARSMLPLRIGIATGPVVPRDGDIFGRTVNLAARIAAEARLDEILVCAATRAPIEAAKDGRFRFEPVAGSALKGFAETPPFFAVSRQAVE